MVNSGIAESQKEVSIQFYSFSSADPNKKKHRQGVKLLGRIWEKAQRLLMHQKISEQD